MTELTERTGMTGVVARETGQPTGRIEGLAKVTGRATYSYEYDIPGVTYLWPVQSSIAHGRISEVDAAKALALDTTIEVLWYANAPRLAEQPNAELAVLQSPEVSYRGQVVAAVVASTLEGARQAAALVRIRYEELPHEVVLRVDDPHLYAPERVNANYPTDTATGSIDDAMRAAAVTVDATYRTPAEHNNPMEPHASIARWVDGSLQVWDSNQGPSPVAAALATLFKLAPDQVRVITENVGGGFGSKGTPRLVVVLAALAARAVGRPVKLALPRQAMFALIGYRTPTIQRVRLAADGRGTLLGIGHEIVEQSSRLVEFAEQTGVATRHLYRAPNRLVTHRLARLDVPTPSWMRAPGEAPGMYALECAMDELAGAVGIDPIELRIRNEPAVDPDSGLPFSSRHYVECLREGARRFGWATRPRAVRDGRMLVGTGVAGSTYPVYVNPATASARVDADGRYTVSIAAADIGQGSRTVLHQIAADALGVDIDRVTVRLGDSRLPPAPVAGGSSATGSWGWAVLKACRQLRGSAVPAGGSAVPAGGAVQVGGSAVEVGTEVTVDTRADVRARPHLARYAFGAHFVEVRVDTVTGEVRVARMLGIFAAGRIMNPRLARSQLIGGMTMGISMALFEEGLMDPRFGDYANHDLAGYHVAVHADIPVIEVHWLDERDDSNPLGGKGIGEIGIVGSAAAVANAVADATGHRIRDLPIRPDKLLTAGLPG